MSHENSRQHLKSVKAVCARKSFNMQIDLGLVNQYENDVKYWRKVCFRVVSMVKFLCILGLAFGSKNKLIGSPSNGNYLGIFELLSEYDAFLAEHIRVHASNGRGHPSYL